MTDLPQTAPAPLPAPNPARAHLPVPAAPSAVARQGQPGAASPLSPAEKASIILVALGPTPAATLLRDVGARRVRRFARIVNQMREIPPAIVERTIAEFLNQLDATRPLSGGREELQRFLSEALSKEEVNQILSDVDSEGRSVWGALGDVENDRIAAWLKTEHPQVAAIALSKLSSMKAARILELFEEEAAQDIVLRMGQAVLADAAIVARIGKVIETEFLPRAALRKNRLEPQDLIAAVMNHVSDEVRHRLMDHLTSTSPELAQLVQKGMFTFDHICERVNPRDVAPIVKDVDEVVLMRAFKSGGGVAEEVKEFFLGNITKRLADRLREDLEAMQPVTRKDSDAAKAALVAAIVDKRDRGEIKMIEAEVLDD